MSGYALSPAVEHADAIAYLNPDLDDLFVVLFCQVYLLLFHLRVLVLINRMMY